VLILPSVRMEFAGDQPDAEPRRTERERLLVSAGVVIERFCAALQAQGVASAWIAAAMHPQEATRAALGLEDAAWFGLGTIAAGPMPEGGVSRPRPPIELARHLRRA
jgi:hypothetical protein